MKLVKEYLHCDKGDVCYQGEEAGLTEEQILSVVGALYEVEFVIDADTGTILSVNGKPLDHEQIERAWIDGLCDETGEMT